MLQKVLQSVKSMYETEKEQEGQNDFLRNILSSFFTTDSVERMWRKSFSVKKTTLSWSKVSDLTQISPFASEQTKGQVGLHYCTLKLLMFTMECFNSTDNTTTFSFWLYCFIKSFWPPNSTTKLWLVRPKPLWTVFFFPFLLHYLKSSGVEEKGITRGTIFSSSLWLYMDHDSFVFSKYFRVMWQLQKNK